MASSDAFPETPKHAHAQREWEQRRADRIAGKLNAPRKGIHGLANIVAAMNGRKQHGLLCQCLKCIPEALRPKFAPSLEEPPELSRDPLPSSNDANPERKPKRARKGFKQPAKKWSEQRGKSSN